MLLQYLYTGEPSERPVRRCGLYSFVSFRRQLCAGGSTPETTDSGLGGTDAESASHRMSVRRAATRGEDLAPGPSRLVAGLSVRSLAGRLRASVLVKIVSPLIVAITVGILVTAVFWGRSTGRPGPMHLSALEILLVAGILAA